MRTTPADCHVVFVRAANVGGRNVFRPAQLARELAALDVVNVGAAGTFVVRAKTSAAAVRREILARMPFEPTLVVVPAREVLALVARRPLARTRVPRGARRWVAVLEGRPRLRAQLPLAVPPGKAWSVRLDRVEGCFALGVWRRGPGGFVFPSHVAEKALGVSATTRWWETLERVAAVAHPAPR
jgi:uncharacterized protein (DUF1697 family)